MQLNFPVGTENAGKYATLFYYNESVGRLERQKTVMIDVDGFAQFWMEHASQYVICVGEDESASTPAPDDAGQPEADREQEGEPVSPRTGDGESSAAGAGVMAGDAAILAVLGIAAALVLKRKKLPHN